MGGLPGKMVAMRPDQVHLTTRAKGKIESTVRFVKQNFWPGIAFASLADLNQQAHAWMEKVNHQVHSTTREVPYGRLWFSLRK